jgi:hypothetical protein
LSILVLLLLAAIAEGTEASVLVAGFVAGVVLAQPGQPERLVVQLSGVANGFFVPRSSCSWEPLWTLASCLPIRSQSRSASCWRWGLSPSISSARP